MLQNQTNPMDGNMPMPLLMNFTVPTRIQEANDCTPLYDDINQIIYDMRTVGTKCLKSFHTAAKHNTDNKNEIDDQKTVK